MFLLAIVTFVIVLIVSLRHTRGLRRVPMLRDAPPDLSERPVVSIIIAARNEQKNIEHALTSLLRLDYPDKEIIIVNDRSIDGTGFIIDRLKKSHPELNAFTVTELPDGWLGKNHAQFVGAQAARGDLLLFTDADVVMDPAALSRAVGYFQQHQLDHMAVMPRVDVPGRLLNMIVVCFELFFNFFTRMWTVTDPRSRAFVGVGAFNMLRRDVYERIGTHQAIRLRPDDDMRLGKLVKDSGFKQGFLFGTGMLSVEWYDSVPGLINGLMKNSFSAANYNLWLVLGGTALVFGFLVWPFIGIFATGGPDRILNALSSAALLFCCAHNARLKDQNPWYGLGLPAAALLMIFIAWKASLQTLWRGGIEWRGTFYSLKELKRNRV